jgi:hypothetical protein
MEITLEVFLRWQHELATVEIKMKAIEMRLTGVPVREVMEQLGIRNVTQLKVWMTCYRKGKIHRLQQPVGKQYSYGKGPEHFSEHGEIVAYSIAEISKTLLWFWIR